MQNLIDHFIQRIQSAASARRTLLIQGSGSKHFYGNPTQQAEMDVLDVTPYSGIVDYDPSELVITAKTGTRLVELESLLLQSNQMLAFEPPHFTEHTTLGGTIAAGLSGPRRAYQGSVSDFVLGIRMLDGQGNDLRFGGRVMKNVAGYDVSRLMVGSLGTLGVILEASLKVLPRPETELSICLEMNQSQAIEKIHQWASKPLPISASCYHENKLLIRLSGSPTGVRAACQKIGGKVLESSDSFWQSLRNHTHSFFTSGKRLWRLSVKSTLPPIALEGEQLIEWGGALRWLATDGQENDQTLRQQIGDLNGHATLFYGDKSNIQAFHPLSPSMLKIHQKLKQQFDPLSIFNHGRMYSEF